MLRMWKETIRYLIGGALTTILSFAVYLFFARVIGIEVIISNTISWIVGVSIAFVINKIYVFQNKTTKGRKLARQVFVFSFLRVATLIIENILIYLFVVVFGADDAMVKIFTQILVIVLNYVLGKVVVFKKNNEETGF